MLIVWSTIFSSFWNIFFISKTFVVADTKSNNSFHRIYDADSDVSDESDVESDLNTSMRSNASLKSNQSFLDFNSTMNASFSSKAPSIRSMSVRSMKTPLRASMSALNATVTRPSSRMSNVDLSRDNYEPAPSMYASAQALNRPSSHFGSVHQLNAKSTSTFDNRCLSRLSVNDVPDDFESGITQLSISGLTAKRNFYQNQNGNAPSVASMRQRRSILMPARLDPNEDQMERASISAHQTSWIAGGYWNGSTSPTKRQSFGHLPHAQQQFQQQVNDVFPMMSRTSSQSSGFESMKNGLENNAATAENVLEHETIQSDNSLPIFTGNSFQTMNNFNAGPRNFTKNPFSGGIQSHNEPNSINRNASFSFVNKQNSFDTSSLQMQLPNASIGREKIQFPSFGNNFSKLNNSNLSFPRGNLLRIPKNGQQIHNSNQDITMNENCFMDVNS